MLLIFKISTFAHLHICILNNKMILEILTTENQIQSVEVFDKTIDNIRGAEIVVKSFDPTNTSKYYRYEYESRIFHETQWR